MKQGMLLSTNGKTERDITNQNCD